MATIKPLFDPLSGLRKQSNFTNPQTNIQPMQDNQPAQLQVKPNAFTGMGTSADVPVPGMQTMQANTQTPQQAQQAQQNQFTQLAQQATLQPTQPTETFQKTQQQTQNLLDDPTRGMNTQQQVSTGMDRFNRSAANQLDALGQQTADRFNTGGRLEDLVGANLEVAAQRPQVQQQLEQQARQEELNSILSAIQAGSSISGQEQQFGQQGIQNLLAAASLGEQGLSREQQLQMQANEIRAQAQMQGRQLTAAEEAQLRDIDNQRQMLGLQQEFQGEQSAADRAQALELQANDIRARAQAQGRQLTAAEQSQLRDIETQKLLLERQQGFQGQQSAADRAQALELQANDIRARAEAQGRQLTAAEQAQLRGFEQEKEVLQAQQQFAEQQASLGRAQEILLQSNNFEGQAELTELQGKISAGEQLRAQDFTKLMNEIEFEQSNAMAEQDFSRAVELEELRGDIAAQAAGAQREFITTERIATQGYMTNERIDEQQATRALSILQSDLQRAINSDNIAAQERSQERQNMFDMKMATQDMDFQERMTYLNDELQTAMAEGNVVREKEILQFQHGQDIGMLQEQQGHDIAMAELQDRMRTAAANNDFQNQKALQDLSHQFQADQAYEDRILQQAQIDLQERGLDMQQFNQRYEQIKAANPDAALEFLNESLGDDFNVAKIDQKQAIMDALAVEHEAKMAQYAQTHPEQVEDGQLTSEGMEGFNEFVNSTMYGEGGSANALMDAVTNAANALGDAGSEEYQKLASSASAWTPSVKKDGRGFWNPDVRVIQNPPAIDTPFKYDGRVLIATSGVAEETRGNNYQYFTARDPLTGESLTIRADEKGSGVKMG